MRDDVAPVEEANVDDVMEEEDDDDPNQYINIGCDDAQQYDLHYERAVVWMMPDLPEPECPTADCKRLSSCDPRRRCLQMPPLPSKNNTRVVH